MSLIMCQECKKNISDQATVCPNCGAPVTPEMLEKAKKNSKAANTFGIGCAIMFTILFIAFCVPSKDKPKEYKVIQYESGAVVPVKMYLKQNLKDPKSVEYISWSKMFRNENGYYQVTVKYRAKNSFGGYVIEENTFLIDSTGTFVQPIK